MACSGGTLSVNKMKGVLANGDEDSEAIKAFYNKVIECIRSTPEQPLLMRSTVESLISEASRADDGVVTQAKLTNAYEFSKGLLLHCLRLNALSGGGIAGLVDLTGQLNCIEKAVDKEMQVFRFLLMIQRNLT